VAQKDHVWPPLGRTPHDFIDGQRPKLGVDELHLVPPIDEGPADREQSEGRQVIIGDPATDGGVGRVDQQYAQENLLPSS